MEQQEPKPEPKPFSVGGLIGGLALSLIFGGGLNIIAGLVGMSTNMRLAAFLIGTIPGLLFVAWASMASRDGFAQGLCIGGCIVALVGGACGASMVGTSFH